MKWASHIRSFQLLFNILIFHNSLSLSMIGNNNRPSSPSSSSLHASTIEDEVTGAQRQHLVLVGGGHAHLQVIKAFNKSKRLKHLDVTLVDVQKAAVYSGMVPGCLAGLYEYEETLIPLEPLAKWSDIRFVQSKVIDVDPDKCVVHLKNGSTLNYTVLSIDIGSVSKRFTDNGNDNAFEYANIIATRPIADLVKRIQKINDEGEKELHKWVVVGGG